MRPRPTRTQGFPTENPSLLSRRLASITGLIPTAPQFPAPRGTREDLLTNWSWRPKSREHACCGAEPTREVPRPSAARSPRYSSQAPNAFSSRQTSQKPRRPMALFPPQPISSRVTPTPVALGNQRVPFKSHQCGRRLNCLLSNWPAQVSIPDATAYPTLQGAEGGQDEKLGARC